ncbi:MAG: sensor histidine kinase [Ilumatobacteraceae bacterium]
MKVVRRSLPDPRTVVDLLLAVTVAVLAVVDVASVSSEPLPWERTADGVAYALVVVAAASLVWRRQAPLVVLAVVTTVLIAFWLRGHGALLSVVGLPAVYAVSAHEEHRRRAWWALSVACVAILLFASVSVLDTPNGFSYLTALSMGAFLSGAAGAGLLIRNRERIFVDTERRAAAAEADRLAEAERAVARERSRIAREMHDVVAHGMSVVAVQAAAGQEIVRNDPDKAAVIFATIEAVGRESLTELRRMIGALRDEVDLDASLSPQPGIRDIAAAVAQSSATGVATDLQIEGSQRALAPGIELAAYRIVQEALTNVRKHGGASASATVRIAYGEHDLAVEITDDGRGAATLLSGVGTGHGLIGMRERVDIYGGEFTAGPRAGGGYMVRAVLPIGSPTRMRVPAVDQGIEGGS